MGTVVLWRSPNQIIYIIEMVYLSFFPNSAFLWDNILICYLPKFFIRSSCILRSSLHIIFWLNNWKHLVETMSSSMYSEESNDCEKLSKQGQSFKISMWVFTFQLKYIWVWQKKKKNREGKKALINKLCYSPQLRQRPPFTCVWDHITSHSSTSVQLYGIYFISGSHKPHCPWVVGC